MSFFSGSCLPEGFSRAESNCQRRSEATEICISSNGGEAPKGVPRTRRYREAGRIDTVAKTDRPEHARRRLLLRPIPQLDGRLDYAAHPVEADAEKNVGDILGPCALAGKNHSRATIEIPRIQQHIHATQRVVEARLRDVAIARVIDRAANVVIAELRISQTNGTSPRAERLIH